MQAEYRDGLLVQQEEERQTACQQQVAHRSGSRGSSECNQRRAVEVSAPCQKLSGQGQAVSTAAVAAASGLRLLRQQQAALAHRIHCQGPGAACQQTAAAACCKMAATACSQETTAGDC